MRRSWWATSVAAGILLLLSTQQLRGIGTVPATNDLKQARKLFSDGNYAEALPLFRELAEDSDTAPASIESIARRAVDCLQRLNRTDECDELLESVIDIHADAPAALWGVARIYKGLPHHGFLIGGEFERGNHRGGGTPASAEARDSVRAMQLLLRARALQQESDDTNPGAEAGIHRDIADTILPNSSAGAWRLQILTDYTALPDFETGQHIHHGRGGFRHDPPGAPVDEHGEPVLYRVPDSWDAAKNDGERWRWSLEQMAALESGNRSTVDLRLANFLQQQFGVRNNHQHRWQRRDGDHRSAIILHELEDSETWAHLANGPRRLSLPNEFNHISILKRVIAREDGQLMRALRALIQVRMNRQQYPLAVVRLTQAIASTSQRNQKKEFRRQVKQITGHWITFDSVRTQAAGTGAVVAIRYRNGSQVKFTAQPIDIERLLTDLRDYLAGQPAQLDHERLQIGSIGHLLVKQKKSRYLGDPVANWTVDLEPPEGHFDATKSITTPLQKGGAYWLTAEMADGNQSQVIVWVADIAITRKRVEQGSLYFVADAASGQPIAKADLEFFGFKQERIGRTRKYRVMTRRFADRTDDNGLTVVSRKDNSLAWTAIARTPDGRLAYDGFHGIWQPIEIDEFRYNQVKVYSITDRPVYRPNHEMNFRIWVRQPRYHEDKALHANRPFVLQIRNPRGDVIEERSVTSDRWGGIDGNWSVPSDAVLGTYSLVVCRNVQSQDKPQLGSGSFRVEEYRKPEYKVSIEAPERPVKLGDKISATIDAQYYFGAPVTEGDVHYKVERTKKDARWFAPTPWDWLYSPGYWWFTPDAEWYPGWKRWGCFGPVPPWIGWSPDPPEVVAEGTTSIRDDGQLKIDIDTTAALEQHGDSDHNYHITVEVRDQSRRTITASGDVLVARDPFKVFVWTDRGHYQTGNEINLNVQARTPDGRPVSGPGKATLYRVTWNGEEAEEAAVEEFELQTDDEGQANVRLMIPQAGQYRLAATVTDSDGNTREGGQLLYVRGNSDDGRGYRFNDLELILDRKTYEPGQDAVLQINTEHEDSTVLLFLRPMHGICPQPEILRLRGKSTTHRIPISASDMPNIFVEALTISNGRLHTVTKEIFVPPRQKIANVEIVAAQEKYRPGEEASVQLQLTDQNGRPFVGNTVLTAFDASLEYIAAGSIPEIREFFWNAKRHYYQNTECTLQRTAGPVYRDREEIMQPLSAGGPVIPVSGFGGGGFAGRMMKRGAIAESRMMPMAAPAMADGIMAEADEAASDVGDDGTLQPEVRSNFADTALWLASVESNTDGLVDATFTVPDNLTTWKIRAWALGDGTRVGSGSTEVICSKNLIIRPQTPRFFTQKDEITLSAIVHNYLETAKDVQVILETEGGQLRHLTAEAQTVRVEAGGEVRVDWPVQVVASGEATVRMKALTDEESDAAELKVPARIHGLLKTESFAGVIRPRQDTASLQLQVPSERIEGQSRLEIRYSPSLAGAMVDALPYLLEYPYGCTEQTLNRFLPAVLTQQALLKMGLDLEQIRTKRTNLNSQETGDPKQRRQRHNVNPVFNTQEMQKIVRDGLEALTEMQLPDGGWGWFSGYGEHASPHLTALVTHGLTVAQQNDVPVLPDVVERGVTWLKRYQARELRKLREGDFRRKLSGKKRNKRRKPWKDRVDNMDALVAWVLSEHDGSDTAMTDYLYRDRTHLSVYSKSLTGLVLDIQQDPERRDMLLRNIEQFLQQDDENQTAWLQLNEGYWWYWYGSENEAHAMYLKLLLKCRPDDELASRLVKYLLNNRRATGHWNSTRDTALVIESLAEYIRVSGEDQPNMTVEVLIDGQVAKRVKITSENLFSFDNVVLLEGDAVRSGTRNIEIRRSGRGPLYYNAYLTNFTLEDPITSAGLEVKVRRRFFRLERNDNAVDVRGARGQAVKQQSTAWNRIPLENLDAVSSGDLIEIELLLDSKNDYEYLMLEDSKPSGFEPDDQRSGYVFEGLRAYRELRDDRVTFFLSQLARGNHSISYRLRAETPGRMAALPAKIEGMYAPELVGNSNEFRLQVRNE